MLIVSDLRIPPPIREAINAETVTIQDIIEMMGTMSEALARYEATMDLQYLKAAEVASVTATRHFSQLTLRIRAGMRQERKDAHAMRNRLRDEARQQFLAELRDKAASTGTVGGSKRAQRIGKTLDRAMRQAEKAR